MVVGVGGAKLKLVKPQEIPLVLECFLSNVSQSKVAVSRKKSVYVFFHQLVFGLYLRLDFASYEEMSLACKDTTDFHFPTWQLEKKFTFVDLK